MILLIEINRQALEAPHEPDVHVAGSVRQLAIGIILVDPPGIIMLLSAHRRLRLPLALQLRKGRLLGGVHQALKERVVGSLSWCHINLLEYFSRGSLKGSRVRGKVAKVSALYAIYSLRCDLNCTKHWSLLCLILPSF